MPSFHSLSLELVQEIVDQLCLHCTSPEPWQRIYEELGILKRDRKTDSHIATLTSLCLTSRWLNDIATRRLYHRPSCAKWWLLARTLIARRDIAQYVKQLNIGDFLPPDTSIPREVSEYYIEKRLPHVQALPEAEHANFLADIEEKVTSGEINTVVNILISLCPNLENLDTTISYFEVFSFCLPQSIAAVKNLAVNYEDLECGIRFEGLMAFFLAAPNLTAIHCFALEICDGLPLTLDHVTLLDLQDSCISTDSLANILRACPRLETLKYIAGGPSFGDEQFDPQDAKDVILEHAPNLKYFNLDMIKDTTRGWDEEVFSDARKGLAERNIDFLFTW
ncbi:hypothetical protein MMYC01_206474 [Madurella mycetomatis]|uniref:F-box domain-containing protein n=1 Tax=Madurella mycetomatis TaxID=100816 RepID=A0A175W452_9PEZI|nr:hypothetical protein MMYC01_206474 [Madurella mycetomatis]